MAGELVPMTKDGDVIEVHPSCVADHKRLGWVEAPPAAEPPPAPEPKPRRGRPAAQE